ncbi:MAG: lysozyme inhibitor LprI family protein [Aeromonas allosaccharophila]
MIYVLMLLMAICVQASGDCKEPMTQAAMNICAMQDYTKADAELNAAYKKLAATLDKEQLGRLKTAQRAWITFRDAQCRYEAGVYEGGSIAPLVHSSCLTKLTEQRTKDLIEQLDQP